MYSRSIAANKRLFIYSLIRFAAAAASSIVYGTDRLMGAAETCMYVNMFVQHQDTACCTIYTSVDASCNLSDDATRYASLDA